MNILITGASGFIGSYLCDFFIKQDHTVIATARNKSRIPAISSPHLYVAEFDVLRDRTLGDTNLPPIDAVIHTATSNDIISKKTEDGILLSSVGTRNVLELCLEKKIPRMIFFSTFQVYGTELEGEITEESPVMCKNDYGLNHIFGEHYVEMYAREKGITGVVVRPSNVFGKFSTRFVDRWTLVPGCFCREIKETGTIQLRSSGRQTRNFVSLENIGRSLIKILNARQNRFEIYNIASSKNYSILEVAQMVKEVYEKRSGKRGRIEILDDKPSAGNSFKVNLEKLLNLAFEEAKEITLSSVINEIFIFLDKNE